MVFKMTHLLDTDHLSVLQQESSPERAVIVLRINETGCVNVLAAVISFHEQMRGAHAFINSARKREQLVRGYGMMSKIIDTFSTFRVLPFDDLAASIAESSVIPTSKIGTMDLRIASIALANDLTLVTRNTSDFVRVPNLKLEDWTK